MGLATGTKLGPYEIVAPAGAGGMGEVYRARDTRLDRTVAIKVLPARLSSSSELRQRFDREARAISSLQHPHICTLHDIGHQDGVDYLVLEYLEGETLADRLQRGPLPVADVLKIGIEIAGALERAHKQGIVHRDLKPGNIILTKSGAKLTDFGLAKPAAVIGNDGLTLTTGKPLTSEGTLVGTFHYMSPEQLEGKEADARSDIFGLGAVLYEMVTGRRAFEGKSQISVLAAILEKEPEPVAHLQPLTPPALERLIRTCLAKDPDQRFQCAADLSRQLQWIAQGSEIAAEVRPTPAEPGHRRWLPWAVAGAAVLAAVVLAILYTQAGPRVEPVVRSYILPPEKTQFTTFSSESGPIAISPDGLRIAFSADDAEHKQVLWVRALASLTAQPLAGTEGAIYPFWSHDSRYIGFFADGKLKKIEASGGPPQTMCDAPDGRGGTWNAEDTILFAPSPSSPIQRVSAAGGTPADVVPATSYFSSQRWPYFLPDNRHFLYYSRSAKDPTETGIYVRDLEGKPAEGKLLLRTASNAIYAPPGYLLYVHDEVLYAQPFDARTLKITGDAKPLAEHVAGNNLVSHGSFSTSENGVLVFQGGPSTYGGDSLVWVDLAGKQLGTVATAGDFSWPRISPDGKSLAIQIGRAGGLSEIWVFDLARGTRTRLTFGPGTSFSPVWSPDGTRIYYSGIRKSGPHIFCKAANGTGEEQLVYDGGSDERVRSISADGRYLFFERIEAGSKTKQDIWVLPLFGDRKPFPLVRTEFIEIQPFISPDGKWVAYASTESGRLEVYITSFPSATSKFQVSTGSGQSPRWRPDGKELFYVTDDRRVMAVDVSTRGGGLVLGVPHALPAIVTNSFTFGLTSFGPVEVAPDGRRLLIAMTTTAGGTEPATLVLNWPAELKK